MEGVEEYVCTFRGVNSTPLSYVVKKYLVPTDEADDPSNGYDTIDEEIIARDSIVVAGIVGTTTAFEANGPFIASYLTDIATVWGKLTSIFEDSTAWTCCKFGKR